MYGHADCAFVRQKGHAHGRRRGHALGRRYGRASAASLAKRFTVERIRLNSGGYTSGGRYYGTGAPLFAVTDSETDRTTEVRAGSAKEARQKVMETVFGPPPKNPLHAEARDLRKQLHAEALKESDPPAGLIASLKGQVEALAAKVHAANPSDISWRFYNKDMETLPERGRYVMGGLHRAMGMVEGAAERLR